MRNKREAFVYRILLRLYLLGEYSKLSPLLKHSLYQWFESCSYTVRSNVDCNRRASSFSQRLLF